MLSRLDCHCEESPRFWRGTTKQSVYFDTKLLFILFLFFLLSFTPLTNLHPQTSQPNPDSIPFAPAVNYWSGGYYPTSVFCADLDGDGYMDLAVANYVTSTVSILKNNGNGAFQSAVSYGTGGTYPTSVFCADLDDTLGLDLAVANHIFGGSPSTVSILKNNGNGAFPSAVTYEVAPEPQSVFCADLDGDDDVDLAVAAEGNIVSILKNNGDGTFDTAVGYGAKNRPWSVFSAELDTDSYSDLAVANLGYADGNWDSTISILINNGNGTFKTKVDYRAGLGPSSVFCADLDGDDDVDLAVANCVSDDVSILKNNGDGTFDTAVFYGVGFGPQSVFCADLDGDKDLDLAVVNFHSNNISILKNNGDGTFQTAVDYGTGNHPVSVFCADLDGDLDLDLAVADDYFGGISILLNLSNKARPDSFSLISPPNTDSVRSPVTLQWQKANDPNPNDTVRYDLYLSRFIVFDPDSTIVYDSLQDTSFTDSLGLKNWYWKVKAYDKWGAERWSDQAWSFYVYVCGDCNGDGKITVTDVVCEINYLFKGGSAPVPLVAGDVNCDGKETVSDVVYKINYLFKGGPKPCQDCP